LPHLFLKHCNFLIIDISQGSVATRFGCVGADQIWLVANFPLSLTVKEFWKSVNIGEVTDIMDMSIVFCLFLFRLTVHITWITLIAVYWCWMRSSYVVQGLCITSGVHLSCRSIAVELENSSFKYMNTHCLMNKLHCIQSERVLSMYSALYFPTLLESAIWLTSSYSVDSETPHRCCHLLG